MADRPGPASVVIVNWNAGAALDACLESVLDEAVGEVIVVDNASTDGSAETARARHPSVRMIDTGANLGFAAGANRGAEAARGDVLVFLNPDTRVARGAITSLVGTLLAVPGAGIAGGGLVDEAGRWQPGAARFAPVAHLVLDTTVGRVAQRLWRAPRPVDWVYGTFMAVRRDLFRQLGGFDTRYFIYGEDLDLCHRAAALGARTIQVPGARAVHGPSVSAARRFGARRPAEVLRGEMRFYAARGGPRALGWFRLVGACKFALKAAGAVLLGRGTAAAASGRLVRECLTFRPGSGDGRRTRA